MNNVIRMAFQEPIGIERMCTPAWDVKPKTWWQRLCWRLLMRAGVVQAHFDERQLVRHVLIDIDKLVSAILREAEYMLNRCYQARSPLTVLLGPDEFVRLMEEPGILQDWNWVPFIVEAPSVRYRQGWLRGLRITIIPWMKGVLVY